MPKPAPILTETIALELGAQEPWPNDVKLYEPYEMEQILLPDNANCLAVQAFLKMCGLPFTVEYKWNAEYMSPSGKVPFIKCGAYIRSELEPIVQFVNTKGISLTTNLDAEEKTDMRAYSSLVNNVLGNAELYVCWVDNDTYNSITKPRYSSVFPWPLNHIQTAVKRSMVIKQLKALGWYNKSLEQVYEDVGNCCNSLSERLDDKEFFFGSKPTELDALVFGHLFTVITTPLPNSQFAEIVRKYPTLVQLAQRIEQEYFNRER